MLKMILTSASWPNISFVNLGKEARVLSTIAAFNRQINVLLPDLVILDVRLPDGNGVSVCNELKSSPLTKHIPVLMMSANENMLVDEACKADGAIRKPFRIADFESSVPPVQKIVISSDEPVAKQLEDELMRLKAQLRSAVEQHEFHAEELKASNEELQAMNEELRSATEELETSKEELQSMNEELRTVNQELKVKIEETTLSSNNLQNLINSTSIGTIFLDRSFRIALFTPAVQEIFNLIQADHGRPLSDITHRLNYQGLLQDTETVLSNLHIIEREVTTHDNKAYLMRVLPYRTAEDSINGVVITFVDITVRTEAERALRESVERFRAIVSQTAVGICLSSAAGVITFANQQFCNMLGYPAAEVIGKSFLDFMTPEDRSQNRKLFTPLMRSNHPLELELRIVCKDRSIKWVNLSASAIRNPQNEPQAVAAVLFDVTKRKELEQQKDIFLSLASHELKTPVTSILGYTEILQRILNEDGDRDTVRLVDRLNKQVVRLVDLLHSLLDTTRISKGHLTLRFTTFDINDLIEECATELRALSDHKLRLDLKGRGTVWGDPERIRQALVNLVTNAIKFSPPGSEVIVSSLPEDGHIKVLVQDFGIGIPKEAQVQVFDRYFRITGPERDADTGLGLGLYISAEIIKGHGGTIGVMSEVGKGATFYFTLPTKQQPENERTN